MKRWLILIVALIGFASRRTIGQLSEVLAGGGDTSYKKRGQWAFVPWFP